MSSSAEKAFAQNIRISLCVRTQILQRYFPSIHARRDALSIRMIHAHLVVDQIENAVTWLTQETNEGKMCIQEQDIACTCALWVYARYI